MTSYIEVQLPAALCVVLTADPFSQHALSRVHDTEHNSATVCHILFTLHTHTLAMPPTLWLPNSSIQATKHLTSSNTRREALSLYREILRTCKAFHWCDEKTGKPWNIRLKEEARKEFDASRDEKDPLLIARMLVTGRDCVQQIQNKFNEADRAAWSRIERDSSRRI